MNFLEVLICLGLIGILAGISVFGYQDLIIRTGVNADVEIIKTALSTARDQARRNLPATVFCNATLCQVQSSQGETRFKLSGEHLVTTQLFPVHAQGVFTFEQGGMTAFQNGTIQVIPEKNPEKTKKIIISQGGRIR